MSVCRLYVFLSVSALGVLTLPTTAWAQYRPGAVTEPAVGEQYHIEASYAWWNAEPELIVNSESLGILGTDVNLVNDLGIEQKRLGKFDLVLKPGKKHRLRFERLPIKYETDAFPVQREFVFNGQRYTVGLPVTLSADLSSYSFGYEYDFLYFSRGFVGASANLKYSHINVDLLSPIGAEFVEQAAPIPAFGFAGRGYPHKNLAIDFEMQFFNIPDSLAEQINGDGTYRDVDLHGTYNFTKNVGAQLGWHRTTVFYTAERDSGDLKFKGWYFGGVVRY